MDTQQEKQLQADLTLAYHDYQKLLNTHAFFKVGNHAAGEDLVQATFMKTWVYLVKGGKIDIMKAFLYHTLNQLIIDGYRKHKACSLDALLEKGFEPGAGDSGRLVNILDGKTAMSLISLLPAIYQKIMNMRYKQELSLKEISGLTGQTKNTIAVQMHRGLAKLKFLFNNGKKNNLAYN